MMRSATVPFRKPAKLPHSRAQGPCKHPQGSELIKQNMDNSQEPPLFIISLVRGLNSALAKIQTEVTHGSREADDAGRRAHAFDARSV